MGQQLHAVSRPSAVPGDEVQESDNVPDIDDEQASARGMPGSSPQLWRSDEVCLDGAEESNTGPFTCEDLMDWTSSYFDNWHPAYPFVHAPYVLEYFNTITQRDTTTLDHASDLQYTVLRSMISISLADRRQTGVAMRAVPQALVFQSYDDAMYAIMPAITQEISMLSLQAVLSVQLFFLSMLRYNAASRLAGLTARMAFHLGLHVCPGPSAGHPNKEAELRQRLFWSLFCIDRQASVRLGLPPALQTRDMDVCYPGSEKHGESTSSTYQLLLPCASY